MYVCVCDYDCVCVCHSGSFHQEQELGEGQVRTKSTQQAEYINRDLDLSSATSFL